MSIEPTPPIAAPATATSRANATHLSRRSTAHRLRDALIALGDHQGQVLAHAEKSWASITFAGERHTVTIRFTGSEAVAAGEAFINALPEHEFDLRGQLVAEATITEAEHRLIPAPELVITCELLLLEEG